MKLIVCLECWDIFNLTPNNKTCGCGESSGRYTDEVNVEIKGSCKVIGFLNSKFHFALQMQKIEDEAQKGKPTCCDGVEFTAFMIPGSDPTVKRVNK